MKFKTTVKNLKSNYGTKFMWRSGYCDLQNILHGVNPVSYTCGVYGWNFDAYDVDGVLITTGYRGMIGALIPHDLVRKYDARACKIINAPKKDGQSWDNYDKTRKNKLAKNLQAFINELYKKGV